MSNFFLRRSKDEMIRTLQAYQAAVDVAAIVSITDTTGKIIYVNDKFVEISKYRAEELIGQTHKIVNSGFHPDDFFSNLWETITGGHPWRGEIRNRDKEGNFYWVDTVITPVLDHKGKIFQYLSVRNLITRQKDSEEKMKGFQQELIQRENQLKEAQQVSKTGSWYLDIVRNSLEWSEEAYRIFGIPQGTIMTYQSFLEKVHPLDRELVNNAWEAALRGAPYEIEHRIITPKGEKWVREKAKLEMDAQGQFIKGIGTVQDITEKKADEESLKISETLYKNLFNNSPFPIGILDKKTLQFLDVNDTAVCHYGYSKPEFLQLTAFDIRVRDEHDALIQQIQSGDYSGNKKIRRHLKKNGEIICVEPSITEINYKGKDAFLISINDVTENLNIHEQLLEARVRQQKEISRAVIEAQEKNREWIGRELHDNVNQLLVASNMYLKNIKHKTSHTDEYVTKSIEIINEAIGEIRKLSWSLVPPTLDDIGLKDSIENLLHYLPMENKSVECFIDINESLLPEGVKINIYRIIQEQVNNIIKHSHATNVKINMKQFDHTIALEISDNGIGFDTRHKAGGIGLNNIIRRTEVYDGKVAITSSPGKGCTVAIKFDVEAPEVLNN